MFAPSWLRVFEAAVGPLLRHFKENKDQLRRRTASQTATERNKKCFLSLFLFYFFYICVTASFARYASVRHHTKCDAAPTRRQAIYKPPNWPESQSGRQKAKEDVKERRWTETVVAKGGGREARREGEDAVTRKRARLPKPFTARTQPLLSHVALAPPTPQPSLNETLAQRPPSGGRAT